MKVSDLYQFLSYIYLSTCHPPVISLPQAAKKKINIYLCMVLRCFFTNQAYRREYLCCNGYSGILTKFLKGEMKF